MSLIYLDNSATSFPKAPGVAEAVQDAILNAGSSGRASYEEALKGSRIIFTCRENLARLFSVKDSSRIILNSGATESLNTVIQGYLKQNMKVLTSSAEHNSVMRVLQHQKIEKNITLNRFNCHNDGSADLESFREQLKDSPDLLVICHSSNVTGAVFPIKEMISEAHKYKTAVCIDGAQSAGHEEINLEELQADFFCFSGHKGLLGPAGTGGFYIREEMEIDPLIYGGTGSLSNEEYQPQALPDRYESGTRNIPGFAGLSASVSFILNKGIDVIKMKEEKLTASFIKKLKEIKHITVLGPDSSSLRNSVISLICDTMDISELAEYLDEAEIAQRMGLHCSPSAHKTLGTLKKGGTIRLSPGYFNSEKDIEETVTSIRTILHGK